MSNRALFIDFVRFILITQALMLVVLFGLIGCFPAAFMLTLMAPPAGN